jgi:poly(3-hydroxybutyrate) depolymerase
MNGRPHRSGLLPSIGGAAGPMLSSLNPNKIIFRGWSGSAHMVSWLIQAVATKQLTGIGIAAGLMFSGGVETSVFEPFMLLKPKISQDRLGTNIRVSV